MKQLKIFWTYLFLIFITSLCYFQFWYGPFKNWSQIQLIANYASTYNEMLVADALHYLQNGILVSNVTGLDLDSFAVSNYSFLYQYCVNILSKILGNPQFAINLYNLFGNILLVLVTFEIFKRLKVRPLFAAVFSVLYCYSFYHLMQDDSILMGWYFIVPFYFYFIVKIFNLNENENENEKLSNLKRLDYIYLLLLATIAPFLGIVYSVIGTCLILAVGLMTLFSIKEKKKNRLLITVLIYFLISIISIQFNLSLNEKILNFYQYPGIAEIDQHSFKISQLFLPHPLHRNENWSAIADAYIALFPANKGNYLNLLPINGHNVHSSLGWLATLSLVFILIATVYLLSTLQHKKWSGFDSTANAVKVAFPNFLVLLLMASFGSGGALLATFIPSLAVEWYRASQFLLLFCFFVVAVLLQDCIKRISSNKGQQLVSLMMAGAVLIFGLYDQTPSHCGNCRSQQDRSYQQLDKFYQDAIFQSTASQPSHYWLQLPNAQLGVWSASSYQYLYQQNKLDQYTGSQQHWRSLFQDFASYQHFQKVLKQLSPQDQILVARYLGANGVIVNTDNWCNWKAESSQFEKLASTLSLQPLDSSPMQANTKLEQLGEQELLVYASKAALNSEQQTHAQDIMNQMGFVQQSNRWRSHLDWSQLIDFSQAQYPAFVKRVEGVIGQVNRNLTDMGERCVYSGWTMKEQLIEPTIKWGDVFPNPFAKNSVRIDTYADLPSKFKLYLDLSWVPPVYPSQERRDKVELDIQVADQHKTFEVGRLPQQLVVEVESNNKQSVSRIELLSKQPFATLQSLEQSPQLKGVLLLKAIRLEAVNP